MGLGLSKSGGPAPRPLLLHPKASSLYHSPRSSACPLAKNTRYGYRRAEGRGPRRPTCGTQE